ncbi:MAG: TetR family transcriptional regulator [Deltaproteobacteria bacterium RIFOXYD12_FULL_50_9]|nr:MAG: TetR family transcriptional regulator [Deltaproteobacteria bacterium RIFOXYD12_FULL_50_9]
MNIHSGPDEPKTVYSEKRAEILRAALELIAEHGFHGAPMSTIAVRAGVGAGTIYRYFENKDVLIKELFLELHEKICAWSLKGYEADKPLRQRFLHFGTALLRYFIANPRDFRYLEQYHNSPYGAEFRRDRILGKEESGGLGRGLLEEGVAQQIVKDLPLAVLFSLAFGPLVMVARDHILGFVELDDFLIQQTVQACWDGIKK